MPVRVPSSLLQIYIRAIFPILQPTHCTGLRVQCKEAVVNPRQQADVACLNARMRWGYSSLNLTLNLP